MCSREQSDRRRTGAVQGAAEKAREAQSGREAGMTRPEWLGQLVYVVPVSFVAAVIITVYHPSPSWTTGDGVIVFLAGVIGGGIALRRLARRPKQPDDPMK